MSTTGLEMLAYMGLPSCLRLSNGDAEVILSTVVGPRILRYALAAGENALGEYPEKFTATALGDWRPYAGHRIWAWPELFPATYAPDNVPIEHSMLADGAVELRAPIDAAGLQKQLTVALDTAGSGLRLEALIFNHNLWPVKIAPWQITVHRGGVAVLPRAPYQSHDACVTAVQSLTLFSFTELQDPRYTLGKNYCLMRAEGQHASPQKLGLRNLQGWCAHVHPNSILIRRFDFDEAAEYPDFGANNEAYVAGDYMEIEVLGPVRSLQPGESTRSTEQWSLYPGRDPALSPAEMSDEASLERCLLPLLRATGNG